MRGVMLCMIQAGVWRYRSLESPLSPQRKAYYTPDKPVGNPSQPCHARTQPTRRPGMGLGLLKGIGLRPRGFKRKYFTDLFFWGG